MKHFYLTGFLVFWCLVIQAQEVTEKTDTLWRNSINFGFNFNQAAFSDNWTGGGVNSIAFSSLLNTQANYKKGKWSWNNELDMLYGVINNQGQDFRKSQDRIFLDSKVGYDISDNWNGYGSLTFLTQFAPGFRYEELPNGGEDARKISDFLAPAFITSSIGFEYVPNDAFTLRLSPFSPRITIVTDTTLINNVPKNYGVDQGETIRYEWLALQMQAEYSKDLTENINLQSRYLLFANYETLSPEQIDHRIDATLSAKLTDFINLSVSAIMIYDFDQINEVQFSQLLGIGILLQKDGVVAK